MRYFLLASVLSILLIGCGGDEPSATTTSTSTTSYTTSSTTAVSTTSTGVTTTATSQTTPTTGVTTTTNTTGTEPPPPLRYLWLGEMCGAPDGWTGSETVEISNDAGVVQCVYTWDAQSKGDPVECDQCSFAFDVQFSNGRQITGTCDAAGLGKDAPHPTEQYGYSTFFDDGKFTFKNVLLHGQIGKGEEILWRVAGGMTAGAKESCYEYDLL